MKLTVDEKLELKEIFINDMEYDEYIGVYSDYLILKLIRS